MKNIIWTENKINWLRENKNKYKDANELLNGFNKTFKINKTMSSLKTICNKKKISLRYKQIKWNEKVDWLERNKSKYNDREDILKAFNKKFKLKLTLKQLQITNNRFNLKLPRAERLISDNIRNNLQKPKKIGSEVIKHDKDRLYIKTGIKEYMAKQRYLYEQHHNVKLKHNDIIVFLDNDNKNFHIDNLYKITRNINGILLRNNLFNVKDKILVLKFGEWKQEINILNKKAGGKL